MKIDGFCFEYKTGAEVIAVGKWLLNL